MKLFVFDDHPWMAQQVESHLRDSGNTIQVHALSNPFCQESHGMDAFFNGAWEGESWYEVSSTDSAGKASLKVISNDAPDQVVFLINVSLKSSISSYLQDQDGVEVLKHIRLSEELGELRMAYVVLYSVERPGALLWRKPGNLMMVSKGATLLYLPNDMKRLLDLNWLKLPKADLSPYYFTPFVACNYRQPDSAHMYSNWWGMRQFVEAHNELSKSNRHIDLLTLPDKVSVELGKLENKKASYLNQTIIGEVGNNQAKRKISFTTKQTAYRIVHLDDERGWQEIIKNALGEYQLQVEIPPLALDPGKTLDSENSPFSVLPSGELDQGRLEGWLKRVLPLDGTDKEPDLVLLDLRMRGSSEAYTPVEETSGAHVASIIRKLRPGLPIILMTASNKAWTYRAATMLGIDGYWMKEGIGEHLLPGSSVENYVKLLELIRAALSDEYQSLKKFAGFIALLEYKKSPWWWEKGGWEWWDRREWEVKTRKVLLGKTSNGDRQTVLGRLGSIMILYREFLRASKMGGYLPTGNIRTLHMGVAIEIRSIIEHIHGFNTISDSTAADSKGRGVSGKCGLVVHDIVDPKQQQKRDKVTLDSLLREIEQYLKSPPDEGSPLSGSYS